MPLEPLPIDEVLPELLAALRASNCAVLCAPTGAGKTTRVPPAILDARIGQPGRIVMIEPRRIAARAAARRMATERGCRLGDAIGYQVRFDRCAGANTQVLVVTPGVLLGYLHDDPYLESSSVIIFDEFHERGLESDLALGMVRLIQQTVRPELRILVMSATLDAENVSRYLGDCPIVSSAGRLHPVEIRFEPKPSTAPWPEATAKAASQLLRRTDGDLLVFLPGMAEIRQTARELDSLASSLDLAVLPLHGDLPAEQQDAALSPQSRRKIVLATNVAETSVTVDGITGVLDTGLARQMMFDPCVGLDRLELVPISRASADQRTGRAGRTRPGVCVRMWSEASHRGRPERTEPEIRRVDLAGAVLNLYASGESDPAHFPWLDMPPPATVDQAMRLLEMLGALENSKLTPLGESLARLPVHPRLGVLLIEGARRGCVERAALAAALLAERDPVLRGQRAPLQKHRTMSDVLDRVEALEGMERGEPVEKALDRGASRFILRARDQLVRAVAGLSLRPEQAGSSDVGLLQAIFAAFPDRLARRRNPGGQRGVMLGGRGVKLSPSSGVTECELFVGVDLDAGEAEAVVRQASAVDRAWLPAKQIRSSVEVGYDASADRVTARKRLRFDDLLLEDMPAALPESEEVGRVLLEAAMANLAKVLPQADSPAGRYLTRARCLHQWMPELGLPTLDEADLREILVWLVPGKKSLEEIRNADWLAAIQGRLPYAQQQAIARDAPEKLTVPSGSEISLSYEEGQPPILAVRIQELFGLSDTPTVGAGRVPVLLHLLAPNFRAEQITANLASFWKNTYPQVRKDLRGRYPKHAWPEDPLTAEPQRGAKKRTN